MTPRRIAQCAVGLAIAVLFGCQVAACSDVGDSSAVPQTRTPDDAGPDSTVAPADASGGDATRDVISQGGGDAGREGGLGDGGTHDGTVQLGPEAGPTGTGMDATVGTPDVQGGAGPDAPAVDMGVVTTIADAGSDATLFDAGPDARVPDAGAEVAVSEAAVADAPADTTRPADTDGDSPVIDTGTATDTGADSGVVDAATTPDTGGHAPFTPCTAAPCNAAATGGNNVKCTGQPGGVCTATEAKFVQHDIDVNGATNTVAPSCYTCLDTNFVLDSPANTGAAGVECEDLTTVVSPVTTALNTAADVTHCLGVIDAIFAPPPPAGGPNCASVQSNICYCGTSDLATNCQTGAANGVALAAYNLAAGSATPAQIASNLANTSTPWGNATGIFANAGTPGCTTCLTTGN